MKWSSSFGLCEKCGSEGKIHPSFGKMICTSCKDKRPQKGTGNAGMAQTAQDIFSFEGGICLIRCKKSDPVFGRLFFAHYPKSKGIPGRSLCYIIQYNDATAGIIGFNSPPRNYGLFNQYFGSSGLENNFVINNVFRLTCNEKNLATRVMKMARLRIKKDYENKYVDKLIGIVTFVEPPRTGALYKADNWDYIGESKGQRMKRDSETWEKVFSEGTKKHVYGYKYKQGKTE
jgi:hypothetical protein